MWRNHLEREGDAWGARALGVSPTQAPDRWAKLWEDAPPSPYVCSHLRDPEWESLSDARSTPRTTRENSKKWLLLISSQSFGVVSYVAIDNQTRRHHETLFSQPLSVFQQTFTKHLWWQAKWPVPLLISCACPFTGLTNDTEFWTQAKMC